MEGFPSRPNWLLRTLALALLVVHGALTWQFFGADGSRLTSAAPIVEGQHARQLYYGTQIARVVRDRGFDGVVYDPRFQAGYAIVPWASIECRLATVSCVLCPEAPEATYKFALLLVWLGLPVSVWLMCRICHSGTGAICGSLVLFLFSAWSPWGVNLLREGETDVLLGTAWLGLALAGMVRSYARPRWWSTPLGLISFAGSLFFWPASVVLLTICLVLFLLMLAGRLPWGRLCSLFLAGAGGIAVNYVWLHEAWQTWWMIGDREMASVVDVDPLFNLRSNLQLLLWPGLLLVVGFLATASLRAGIGGRSAFVWSTGIVLSSLAALVPQEIESLHLDKSHGWWWCSVWLATIPVGKLLALSMEACSRIVGGHRRALIVFTLLASGAFWWFESELVRLVGIVTANRSLQIEEPPELTQTVEVLRRQTTQEGRILWEETFHTATWSALLPDRAARSLVGGLGRAQPVRLETLQVRLHESTLIGRSIEDWNDHELATFADTWNLGWIAAYQSITQRRLGQWPLAEAVADLPGGGKLYRLKRKLTICRLGQAQVSVVTGHQITLTDLVPENGQVVLSLHAHRRMRVTNDRARLETWTQPYDGTPMVRIRLPGPMERLTIEW
jgi:hypothetical protein